MDNKQWLLISLLVIFISSLIFAGCAGSKYRPIDTASLSSDPSQISYRPYEFNTEPSGRANGDATQWTFLYFFDYGDVFKGISITKVVSDFYDIFRLFYNIGTVRGLPAFLPGTMRTEDVLLKNAASAKAVDLHNADEYFIIKYDFDKFAIPFIVARRECKTEGYLMKVKPVGNFSDELWMEYLEAQSD